MRSLHDLGFLRCQAHAAFLVTHGDWEASSEDAILTNRDSQPHKSLHTHIRRTTNLVLYHKGHDLQYANVPPWAEVYMQKESTE